MNNYFKRSSILIAMLFLLCSGITNAEEQSPTMILENFLQAAQKHYPVGTSNQANPMQVADDTSGFWHMKERKARSSHGRSLALFMLFRPTSWTIDMDRQGNQASAIVTITIGNPHMLKLNKGQAEKAVRFTLSKVEERWLLNRYEMQINTSH